MQYSDFDAIVAAMMEWGRDDPMIFNCQVGLLVEPAYGVLSTRQ
jgi:hypothetical protein